MKKEQSAGFIIFTLIDKRIHYLLLHYASGHWDFPKGHIEAGETKHEAAERELKEETGLQATIVPGFEEQVTYFFVNKQHERVHKVVYFFIGYVPTQNVSLSFEHQGFAWLPFEEAAKTVSYENAQQLLQKVDKYIKNTKNKDFYV